MTAPLDANGLRLRLRHSVLHEAASARRSFAESLAKSVPERVESGDCVDGLEWIEGAGGNVRLRAREFHAKFREDESLWLSDGVHVEEGAEVQFVSWDAERNELRVAPNRFARDDPSRLADTTPLCLDRRDLGLEGLLLEGLDTVWKPGNEHVIEMLCGAPGPECDEARAESARARAEQCGFTAAQTEAFAKAASTESVALVQGPPGTGKTRVLAELALHLAEQRCRVFVCAFTHRALDHLLLSIRELSPKLPIFKLGQRRGGEDALGRARIRYAGKLERLNLPAGGAVVGGTPFALRKYSPERRFHFAIVDEAGQMPLVHGAIAMTAARRVIVAGDPAQLPPVSQGEYRDPELGASLHLHLGRTRDSVLLDRSFRLNEELCSFVSSEFYSGRLLPSSCSAGRRLAFPAANGDTSEEDPHARILSPEFALVHARVDHLGRTRRSPEEARLIADLLERVIGSRALSPADCAVLTPFRQQVRAIRSELDSRDLLDEALVVDTVERMQGQERELVVISLSSSDRDVLAMQAEFYFEPGRLCVAVSRARSKCIVVGSSEVLRTRPRDLEQLLATTRLHRLLRACHPVDVGSRYLES